MECTPRNISQMLAVTKEWCLEDARVIVQRMLAVGAKT
jgi:hypothetical protein